PLLALDLPAAGYLVGTGHALARVGTGIGLGDRVGVTALALTGRNQVFLLLLGGGKAHRVGRVPERIPDGTGGLAQLLVEQGLLKNGETLATVFLAVVGSVEAPVQCRLDDLLVGFTADTVVNLAFHLMRVQDLLDEILGFC